MSISDYYYNYLQCLKTINTSIKDNEKVVICEGILLNRQKKCLEEKYNIKFAEIYINGKYIYSAELNCRELIDSQK